MKTLKILDIGCGRNKISGAVGIDIDRHSLADIFHDLNRYPYPLKEASFDQIYAKHIIEHLDDPRAFLREIARILKPGGAAFVETPHFSSRVAYSEPEHKLFYSYFMFDSLLSGIPELCFVERKITFYKTFRAIGIQCLANRYPDAYERFWTYWFPAENIKVLLQKKGTEDGRDGFQGVGRPSRAG
ncbi:MAG: class I SAM-dependent methyltransferase [Candidatus Omnitrophota bacterium]